jgi:hypothetical protein
MAKGPDQKRKLLLERCESGRIGLTANARIAEFADRPEQRISAKVLLSGYFHGEHLFPRLPLNAVRFVLLLNQS